VRQEDRPLGIKALFLLAIVLFLGVVSVVFVVYERDPIKPPGAKRAPSSGSGGAGLYVSRRRGSKDMR
jgi:hypothetical protein